MIDRSCAPKVTERDAVFLIVRRTSLARNTIRSWLRGPVRSEMAYRRSAAPKKIGPYETRLRDALAADARRPRRERRTARSAS